MHVNRWLLPVGAVVLVLATGCANSSTGTDASPSGSPGAGSASASPPGSAPPSGTASAWVRGTHVVLTNSSGTPQQAQVQADVYSNTPKETYTALANGQSLTATQSWNTSGTDVFGRIKYVDGKVVEFTLYNYAVGTPAAEVRDGPSTGSFDPDDAGFQTNDFDQNSAWTPTVNGHKFTITRTGDDADNKNWTVTLTPSG